jgi:hypothetical protein
MAWLLPLVVAAPATAADPNAKGFEFFEAKIRPVLATHCYECHSAKSSKLKGNLLLDTRAGLREGGDSGPAIVKFKGNESLLVKSMRHEEFKMPPKKRLPDEVIADFVKWIDMGAPDPRDGSAAKAYKTLTLEESKSFWSFQPPKKSPAPAVKTQGWARTDVDRFLLAKMEAKGLHPVADAEPAALFRRIHLDLTGLPPTPAELDAFLKDPSAKAFEATVDRLLASHEFGERWARYWLDIARYAESNGNTDNLPYPNAWRYRDYVIKAFNDDRPYDRFIQEQVAGDLLPVGSGAERDECLTATALFAMTSRPRAQNNPDYKYDLIADQVDVATRAFLGLSVMCARCHDHKFDPISQKEYYSIAGIFDSSLMMFGNDAGKGNAGKGAKINGYNDLTGGGVAMGLKEGRPNDLRVCIRGESKDLGETAPRGFLKAVPVADAPGVNPKESGRREFAKYLSSPNNPFTARIAVNRIWQHLFGHGLSRTPDNFGNLGEAPSHPELLDYLAVTFVENGWSTKKMIKSLVMTHAYQMSSAKDAGNEAIDPDNFHVWHMPIRRLDAEAMRDSILAVSGQLDRTPLSGTLLHNVDGKQPKKKGMGGYDSNRRSIYLAMVRGAPLNEVLALFDIANPNIVVAQREVTTVPAQALFLMNSPFIQSQSKSFADRVLEPKDLSDEARVELAYKLALSRLPTIEERDRILSYMNESVGDGANRRAVWTSVCQTLFASVEFRYFE